jgi:hypothetical protein
MERGQRQGRAVILASGCRLDADTGGGFTAAAAEASSRVTTGETGETMPTDLADLTDQAGICRTLYQFAAGIDLRDWHLYRSVFTDEIDVDYSSYRRGSAARMKADAWVARAKALFTGLEASQHCLYNPRIDIDGDSATCVIYVRAEHFLTNDLGDNWFTLGGYYTDRLVRVSGGWKIAAKKLTVTWNRGNRHVLTLGAERAAQLADDTPAAQ